MSVNTNSDFITQMTDSMPERKLSDAFAGINIEESLKNRFSSLGFADFDRRVSQFKALYYKIP